MATEGANPNDRTQYKAPLIEGELPPSLYTLHHLFGFDSHRRSNLSYLEENEGGESLVAYLGGNALILTWLPSMRRKYIFGVDGRGVGAFVRHPSGQMFAVAEKGNDPRVYIYSYPELEVVRVLPKGTERGYSCMHFSKDGAQLATVGMAPDYMLTIWDWNAQQIVLHTKAFGQDVFKVEFSSDREGTLVTSGTGHIRFWKMAETFTGLKLQGDIGKFGKVELTDVVSFAQLPDGKVLSATENGALLLWEGNFIKMRVTRVGGAPCQPRTLKNRECKLTPTGTGLVCDKLLGPGYGDIALRETAEWFDFSNSTYIECVLGLPAEVAPYKLAVLPLDGRVAAAGDERSEVARHGSDLSEL